MPHTQARRRTAPAPLATPRPRPVLVAQADPITCPNCGVSVDAHGPYAASARADLDQHGVCTPCLEELRADYDAFGHPDEEPGAGIPGRDW